MANEIGYAKPLTSRIRIFFDFGRVFDCPLIPKARIVTSTNVKRYIV